mgnify:CR=1 FL=1
MSGAAFNVRRQAEALEFDVSTKQAIDHFHASNGRYPKSHEEFVKLVLEPNHMRLPQAEEGFEVRYNPEDRQYWQYPIEPEEEAVLEAEPDAGAD